MKLLGYIARIYILRREWHPLQGTKLELLLKLRYPSLRVEKVFAIVVLIAHYENWVCHAGISQH